MGFFGFGKTTKGTLTDPVCGMDVTPETAVAKAEHDGTWFYFCSQNCLATFNKNPHKFAHGPGGGHH